MPLLLIILFIVTPFVEIALLIKMGNWLGLWPTLGIVVVTAVVGAYVLQAQGVATMQKIAQSIGSGEPPIGPVLDGFFLAISGAFLLTPGVVTDAFGLLLLVPPVRHALARWGLGRMMKSANFTVRTYTTTDGVRANSAGPDPYEASDEGASRPKANPNGPTRPGSQRPGSGLSAGPVIDGDYEEVKKK